MINLLDAVSMFIFILIFVAMISYLISFFTNAPNMNINALNAINERLQRLEEQVEDLRNTVKALKEDLQGGKRFQRRKDI